MNFFNPEETESVSRLIDVSKDNLSRLLTTYFILTHEMCTLSTSDRRECAAGVWWQTHGDSRKRTKSTAIPGEERNPLLYRLSLYPYSRRRWASKDALWQRTYISAGVNACVG